MNRVGRIIGLTLLMAIAVTALILALTLPAKKADPLLCQTCHIVIEDEQERQYLTETELMQLLQNKHLYPVGKCVDSLSLHAIEELVLEHPMVRTSQCYITPQGQLYVCLSQRVPLLKVITGQNTYFVDTDRLYMPSRSSITTKVLSVTGQPTEAMTCGPLAEMALWLQRNSFWSERIKQIYVRDENYISLIQNDGPRLILGKTDDYRRKMSKLQTFYEQYPAPQDSIPYSALDARFLGQVVGVK